MSARPGVLLLLINVLLAAGLAALALTGAPAWEPPRLLLPDLPKALVQGHLEATDPALAEQIVARPLFFESRRPEVDEAPTEAGTSAADDPFDGVVLDGAYRAGSVGGVSLVDREGKRHRILLGEGFQGWTLASFDPPEVTFKREGEARVVTLRRAEAAAAPAAQDVARGAAPPLAEPPGLPSRVAATPDRAALPAGGEPAAAVDREEARRKALEARRQALERRRQALETRRRQLQAPNAASRTDPFGSAAPAPGKP